MKKKDLNSGNVVELRNENKFIVIVKFEDVKFDLVSVKGNLFGKLSRFNENLEYFGNYDFDIVKVYEDYTLKKVLWERKEKPKLTKDEKAILRNLPKEYKYIARDEYETLCAYIEKPKKESMYWYSADYLDLTAFKHLFQFVKWDEEPHLISDLLGEEE